MSKSMAGRTKCLHRPCVWDPGLCRLFHVL